MTKFVNQAIETEELLERLAYKLTPVRTAKLRASAVGSWSIFIVFLCLVFTFLIGIRPELKSGMMSGRITIGLVGSIILLMASTACFVRLLLPQRRLSTSMFLLAAVGCLLVVASSLLPDWTIVRPNQGTWVGLEVSGWHCTGTLMLFSLLISLPMAFAARYYAPTQLVKMGLFIGLAAASGSFAVLLVHCKNDDLLHGVFYHLIPSTLIAIGASALLGRWLRW